MRVQLYFNLTIEAVQVCKYYHSAPLSARHVRLKKSSRSAGDVLPPSQGHGGNLDVVFTVHHARAASAYKIQMWLLN